MAAGQHSHATRTHIPDSRPVVGGIAQHRRARHWRNGMGNDTKSRRGVSSHSAPRWCRVAATQRAGCADPAVDSRNQARPRAESPSWPIAKSRYSRSFRAGSVGGFCARTLASNETSEAKINADPDTALMDIQNLVTNLNRYCRGFARLQPLGLAQLIPSRGGARSYHRAAENDGRRSGQGNGARMNSTMMGNSLRT